MHKLIKQFVPYSQGKLGWDQPVTINLLSDPDNAGDPLGKTAHYEPNSKKVTLFIDGRHIKDILRSLSHELVHHDQNCKGQFGISMDTGPGYAQNDEHLRNQEKQAYLLGNLHFRDWEYGIKMQQQENKQMNSKKLINEVANKVSRRLIQLKEEEKCKCPGDCPEHSKEVDDIEQYNMRTAKSVREEKQLDEEYQLFEQELDEYLGAGMHPEEVSEIYTPSSGSGGKTDVRGNPLKSKEAWEAMKKAREKKKTNPEEVHESKDLCADVSCPDGKECKEVTNDLGQVYKSDCVDIMNENWYKGNKDQLLFEELTRKWTKKR